MIVGCGCSIPSPSIVALILPFVRSFRVISSRAFASFLRPPLCSACSLLWHREFLSVDSPCVCDFGLPATLAEEFPLVSPVKCFLTSCATSLLWPGISRQIIMPVPTPVSVPNPGINFSQCKFTKQRYKYIGSTKPSKTLS